MNVVARRLGAPGEALHVHVVQHAASVPRECVAGSSIPRIWAGRQLAAVQVHILIARAGQASGDKGVRGFVNNLLRPAAFKRIPLPQTRGVSREG